MRHRVKKRKLGKLTKHRKHMLRNLLRALFEHGKIETSKAKAKEVQRLADKLISTARGGDLAARRQLHRFFGKNDVVNLLVDEIAPLFKDRKSGFTRLTETGRRRGDNTLMARLELIKKPDAEQK